MTVSGPISILMVIFKPLAAILNALSRLMAKFTGSEDGEKPSVTEEELKYIVESIEEEGVLEEKKATWYSRLWNWMKLKYRKL